MTKRARERKRFWPDSTAFRVEEPWRTITPGSESRTAWTVADPWEFIGGPTYLTAMALLATTAGAQDEASRLVNHTAQGYSLDANATPVVQVLTEVGHSLKAKLRNGDSIGRARLRNDDRSGSRSLVRRVPGVALGLRDAGS